MLRASGGSRGARTDRHSCVSIVLTRGAEKITQHPNSGYVPEFIVFTFQSVKKQRFCGQGGEAAVVEHVEHIKDNESAFMKLKK